MYEMNVEASMRNPKPERKSILMNEDKWEEEVLDEVLGDVLEADGNIDFDKLRARGTTMTLDELLTVGVS
jgi:hypothetical protein